MVLPFIFHSCKLTGTFRKLTESFCKVFVHSLKFMEGLRTIPYSLQTRYAPLYRRPGRCLGDNPTNLALRVVGHHDLHLDPHHPLAHGHVPDALVHVVLLGLAGGDQVPLEIQGPEVPEIGSASPAEPPAVAVRAWLTIATAEHSVIGTLH